MPVVQQVVREREACRALPDHQHALPGDPKRQRPPQVERIPARQQRIDLESPGKREHVLQHPCLGLRDVDRLLLLEDAGLHAIVADAVSSRRDQRVVDANHRQRGERPAFGAEHVELRDPLLERAAGERHAERALESIGIIADLGCGLAAARGGRRGAPFDETVRAGVFALLVAPDAVMRLVESADEIRPRVGQAETVASPQSVRAGDLQHLDPVLPRGFDGNQLQRVELARRAKQHAAAVRSAALRRMGRPRGIAQRLVERGSVPASSSCQRITACANASSKACMVP